MVNDEEVGRGMELLLGKNEANLSSNPKDSGAGFVSSTGLKEKCLK